jgi:hypothetical protein
VSVGLDTLTAEDPDGVTDGVTPMNCQKVARIRGRSTLSYESTGREHCIEAK